MREPPLHSAAEVERFKDQLARYAQTEGYALGTVYVERLDTAPAAFEALLVAVRRYDVDAVAAPSRAHLEPLGEKAKTSRLINETNASVMFADPP